MQSNSEFRVCFGNGTTALYAAIVSLGIKRSFIAVQPNVCPNVIVAILASSNRPFFVDIEPNRLGISPDRLERSIRKVSAIIAVHAYGIPCLIDELAALSSKHRIPLIEDCAQAEGARFMNRPVGVFGEAAIFSYGAGKILSLDGGGGMATTRSKELADRLRGVRELLPNGNANAAAEELSEFFKRLYNQYYPNRLTRRRAAASRFFRSLGKPMLTVPRSGLDREIQSARSTLSRKIKSRRKKAEIYARELGRVPEFQLCLIPEGSVPWRFNLRIKHSLRQQILKALLAKGLNVSSWYPDMSRFLTKASYAGGRTTQAVDLDETILNLWLDDDTTENAITKTTIRLKQQLRECRS